MILPPACARRSIRGRFLLAVMLLLPLLARPVAAADLPADLLGTWVVASVVGASPALWGVQSGQALIGKTITITPDHIAIFGRFSGRPVLIRETTGTLASVVTVPQEARVSFPGDDTLLRYEEVGLGGECRLDGKAQQGCPVFLFAVDEAAKAVSLVTYPWGMARLDRKLGAVLARQPQSRVASNLHAPPSAIRARVSSACATVAARTRVRSPGNTMRSAITARPSAA